MPEVLAQSLPSHTVFLKTLEKELPKALPVVVSLDFLKAASVAPREQELAPLEELPVVQSAGLRISFSVINRLHLVSH